MPHGPPHFGTQIPEPPKPPVVELTPKQKCAEDGGKWDEQLKICIFAQPGPETQVETPRAEATTPETFTDPRTGRASGITLADGRTFLGVSAEDVEALAAGERERLARPEGTAPVGTAQAASDVAFRGEQLAEQVGQFGQLGVEPTGFDTVEAVTAGIVGAIPRALGLAATGAAVGAAGGTAVLPGVGTAGGAAIGAAAGFVSGLASSAISNLKSQRSDTTTSQQRVLDEGKQVLQDLASDAAADPTNSAKYLADFNLALGQIDQAYRQMKLDTSRDVGKFETALPNLAEFETFYASGQERDVLVNRMQISLRNPQPIEYNILEQSFRRKE